MSLFRSLLLAGTALHSPPNDGGGDGGSDIPVDDLQGDVAAAWDEEAGRDDAGTEGVGDSRTAPREPARQATRDGQQTQTKDDGADRGDGRTRRGRFASGEARSGKESDDSGDGVRKPAATDVGRDQSALARGQEGAPQPLEGSNADALQRALQAPPPPSFSVRSKAAWEQVKKAYPFLVADIVAREEAANNGFAALKDFKDIKPYAEMATASGTTLSQALHRYTNLEQLARRNPVQGVISVCQGLRLPQEEAAQVLLRAAIQCGARLPSGDRNPGGGRQQDGAPDRNGEVTDPLLMALRPYFTPILEELQGLRTHLGGLSEADRNAKERTLDQALDGFSRDQKNVYFADVQDIMTNLFATKYIQLTGDHAADLKACYEAACQLHPEVREALIEQRLGQQGQQRRKRDQEVADRARHASGSLAGSATPGLERERPKPEGRGKELIENERLGDVTAAYDQVAGQGAY